MKALQFYIQISFVLLTALSVGLQWGVVQIVGWVNMTVEYSHTATISDALLMTFDGKHPCKLCKLVEKAHKGTDKEDQRAPDKKFEVKPLHAIHWSDEMMLNKRRAKICFWQKHDVRAQAKRERPPLPPPREQVSLLNFSQNSCCQEQALSILGARLFL
jgi:hypothetical protein